MIVKYYCPQCRTRGRLIFKKPPTIRALLKKLREVHQKRAPLCGNPTRDLILGWPTEMEEEEAEEMSREEVVKI